MKKLAEMSLDEGLDLVVAVREKRASIPGLDGILSQLQQGWQGLGEQGQGQVLRALAGGGIGAGVGGLAGLASSMNQPRGQRTPLSRALTGAIIGGTGGGLGSLALDAMKSPEFQHARQAVRTLGMGESPKPELEQLQSQLTGRQPQAAPPQPNQTPPPAHQIPDVPGMRSNGQRRFSYDLDPQTGDPIRNLNNKPVMLPDPNGDIGVPQYPAGQTPHPNNNWGDTLMDKADHVMFGQTGPGGERGSSGVPAALEGLAGGAAGAYVGSRMPLHLQPQARSLQALLSGDRAATARASGFPGGDDIIKKVRPLLGQMQGNGQPISAKDLLQSGGNDLKALANHAMRRGGRPGAAVGGALGGVLAPIFGRYLSDMIDPSMTQQAAAGDFQRLQQLGVDPSMMQPPSPPPAPPAAPPRLTPFPNFEPAAIAR